MNISTLIEYFLDRRFLTFASLCATVAGTLILITVDKDNQTISMLITIFFSCLFVLAFIVVWLVVLGAILNALERRRWIKVIYTPIFYLPLLAWYIGLEFSYRENLDVTYLTWTSLIVVAIFACIDMIHTRFVLPLHPNYVRSGNPAESPSSAEDRNEIHTAEVLNARVESKNDDHSPDTIAASDGINSQNETVEIGGQIFSVSEIRKIRSEDHYLQVTAGPQANLVRGRLSEVSDKIPLHYGMQVNRSIWVAYEEIKSTSEAARGRLSLTLRDDEEVIVSSPRKLLLEQQYGIFLSGKMEQVPSNNGIAL